VYRSDPASGDPRSDRRREGRRRTLLKGKIVYVTSSYCADCRVRDISAGGARIVVAADAVSDDPCLIIVKHAAVYATRTAWRRGDEVGLQFTGKIDLGGVVPLPYRSIQKVWIELMPR
jgi:hypothetical protein